MNDVSRPVMYLHLQSYGLRVDYAKLPKLPIHTYCQSYTWLFSLYLCAKQEQSNYLAHQSFVLDKFRSLYGFYYGALHFIPVVFGYDDNFNVVVLLSY